jgi:hypothetical protein
MTDTTLDHQIEVAALQAGICDVDALKLADRSLLKVNAKGETEGVEAMLTALRHSKPFLFKRAKDMTPAEHRDALNAIKAANALAARPVVPTKKATDMTPAEYEKAKANMGLSHRARAFARK